MGVPTSNRGIALRGRIPFLRAASAAASIVLAGCLAVIAPATTASAGTIDTTSAAAVAAAYDSGYAPALTDSVGWTGSVSSCTAGTTSSASVTDSLNAINYVRSLAGLDPVSFTSTLSSAAQKAALMMSAKGTLSHSPTPDWPCYSSDGAAAAGASDLAFGVGGARAISPYMSDPGAGNAFVGHRRWILFPPAQTMGTGSTSNTNALYVFGATAAPNAYADPTWVPWPTSGYFPEPLEPGGRWSLSGDSTHDYDFSNAKVSVKDFDGNPLTSTLETPAAGYGNDTLVWEVAGVAKPAAGSESDYVVSVTGIVVSGQTVSHNYVVRLFNPASVPTTTPPAPPTGSDTIDPSVPVSDPPPPTTQTASPPVPATITGYDRVGQILHSTKPALTFRPTSWTYRWYRDGVRIRNVVHSTHKLSSADLGKAISVRVIGHRRGHRAQSSLSAATDPIQPAIRPTASVLPTLSGLAFVGQTLTVDPGQWAPVGAHFSYRWYRNGKPLANATAATRLLSSRDNLHTETVKVTVSMPGYSSVSVTLSAGRIHYPT